MKRCREPHFVPLKVCCGQHALAVVTRRAAVGPAKATVPTTAVSPVARIEATVGANQQAAAKLKQDEMGGDHLNVVLAPYTPIEQMRRAMVMVMVAVAI